MNEPIELKPEFYNILQECLEAVLAGRMSVDDCLVAYPDYAHELEPALASALLTTNLPKPAMSDISVDLLEAQLIKQFQQMQWRERTSTKPRKAEVVPRPPLVMSRMAATLAIIFLLTFGAGGGLVAASANTMPGDTLYGVKRVWEAIILALASIFGMSDDVSVHLAEARFDELLKLQAQGRLTNADFNDFNTTLENAIMSVDDTTILGLITFMETARPRLENTIIPTTDTLTAYNRARVLLTPAYDANGRLILPTLTELPTPAPTLVFTPTLTFTPTFTFTPTLTFTPTSTETPQPTSTPRIPPTPTRTPTPVPSATATITPSPTLTPTWTPYNPDFSTPDQSGSGNTGTGIILPNLTPTKSGSGSDNSQFFVRQTQQSVFMTQTAIANQPNITEEP